MNQTITDAEINVFKCDQGKRVHTDRRQIDMPVDEKPNLAFLSCAR